MSVLLTAGLVLQDGYINDTEGLSHRKLTGTGKGQGETFLIYFITRQVAYEGVIFHISIILQPLMVSNITMEVT